MNATPHQASRRRILIRAIGAVSCTVAILVLIGWQWRIDVLQGIFPGMIHMKPNAALSFLASGLALQFLVSPRRGRRALAAACAFFVLLVGLLTLAEYLFHLDLGIDQFLYQEPPNPSGMIPGRVAPNTAFAIVLIGSALLMLIFQRAQRYVQYLAFTAGLIGLLALLGYAYKEETLIGIANYYQMALAAALLFPLLAFAILCACAEVGAVATVTSDGPGGRLARRMLPAVLILPLLLEWLRLQGLSRGYYNQEFSVAVLVVSSVAVLVVLVLWNASAVDRASASISHLNRLYIVRSQVNQCIVRLRESGQLFETVCRIAVEDGKFRMAWIGLVEEATGRIRPVAWRGAAEGYLENAFITIHDEPAGRGPTGRAIRENHYFVCNNFHRDPRMTPWREQAEIRGFHSSASFPINVNGRTIGAFTAYSTESDYFNADEIALLDELTGDLAFALESIDLEARRKQAEAGLQQLNEELEGRVAERTAELAATNQELEAFAYSVSHDLRAPLRVIDGFGQALLEDCFDKLDDEGRDFLRRIRAGSQRMGHLIDGLLGLSRLTRGPMQRKDVDLSALAEAIRDELSQAHPGRCVECAVQPGLRTIADENLIRVVLTNLLGNAWKFTGKHPAAKVEFGLTQIEGHDAYFVRDDGAGFDMAYVGSLFGAFRRLHGMNEFEGTGIGLATVQRVIHRHGGRVWAEGRVEQGATFYFTLPLD